MTRALPAPHLAGLITQWTWQPVAVACALALGGWYLLAVRRTGARRWPVTRSVSFTAGLALFVWSTCGFLQVYQSSLYWAWTTQTLLLLLVAPLLVLSGQPLRLARMRAPGGHGWLDRAVRSRAGRVLANPLVGPALVPVLSAVLFFGPVPGWAIGVPALGWVLQPLLMVIGGLIGLPLVDIDQDPSSLAVGLSLAIGSFELVLDAVPGIVLRLHAGAASTYFAHRSGHPWSPPLLHDQQAAGTILWCVAEVIDLPFLLLVFRRWLRADARDAAAADAVLEAERLSRGALSHTPTPQPGEAEQDRDAPWWLSDPAMRRRFRDGA